MGMRAGQRRRDAAGHVDPYAKRRQRYEAVLRPLGLWDLFAAMPRRVQELFWQRKIPDPVLQFDRAVPSGAEHRATRRAIEDGFADATVDVGGVMLTARDFLSVVAGCTLVVRHSAPAGLATEVVRFLNEAAPVLGRCYDDHLLPALQSVWRGVVGPVYAHSRHDTRLLTARLDYSPPTPTGKVGVAVVVSAVRPQVTAARLDGAVRPMYRVRVGVGGGGDGAEWVSWTGRQLGHGDPAARYPVYVQSHALRQLRDRANLPGATPYLEAWLGESLADPRVVERQGRDDLLVEFRVDVHRLGYLVVTPLPELVAVRTFKFLTMERTPEARALERHLRLTRRDVDWLGLHELSAFTRTDLRSDPVLRPLLEACGCGHLFELAAAQASAAGPLAAPPTPLAAEVRRYVRLAA